GQLGVVAELFTQDLPERAGAQRRLGELEDGLDPAELFVELGVACDQIVETRAGCTRSRAQAFLERLEGRPELLRPVRFRTGHGEGGGARRRAGLAACLKI